MQYIRCEDHTSYFLTETFKLKALFSNRLNKDFYIGLIQYFAFTLKVKVSFEYYAFKSIDYLIINCFNFNEEYRTSFCISLLDDRITLYSFSSSVNYFTSNYELDFCYRNDYASDHFYFKDLIFFIDSIKLCIKKNV